MFRIAQTKELENNLKEDERELLAIKDAFEKGHFEGLEKLPLKLDKYNKYGTSIKMPKKLSEKEKKRREERKRLKDLENLEKIQKKLFKIRPGKNNKKKAN